MATLLYIVEQGGIYVNIENLDNIQRNEIKKLYINITNKCPCACHFCLRQTKEMMKTNSLWLEKEPEASEILELYNKYTFNQLEEVIFCGFGEPFERKDTLLKVAKYLKENTKVKIRVNTIGFGNKMYEKDITSELKGLIDTLSISLNTFSKEDFYKVTRSKFGIDSRDYQIDFITKAKKYVPNIVLTVVEKVISDEEIEACRKLANDLGVLFRVREFE